MGWNSWDCYGAAVNEKTVRKNAEYMADKLKNAEYKLRNTVPRRKGILSEIKTNVCCHAVRRF